MDQSRVIQSIAENGARAEESLRVKSWLGDDVTTSVSRSSVNERFDRKHTGRLEISISKIDISTNAPLGRERKVGRSRRRTEGK